MGKELALQRKRLRLFRRPLATLYYFGACAGSAAVRGALWLGAAPADAHAAAARGRRLRLPEADRCAAAPV